jgi:arylsulfatase A-like enzyme
MNTSRSGLLLSVALCLLTFAQAGIARAVDVPTPYKPNILLIVSDDQGYADTGFNGCQDIPTPNLDRLAKSGVRCTSGYVTHAFCSPTRAALMTGRYQQRFGHEFNPVYDPLDPKEGLPLTEKLLPEFLQDAGYVTGWIGKWHLGASPGHTPQARGFKDTFGFIGGGHQFWNWKPNERQYTLPIERNGQPVEVTTHLTTAFGDEAGAFVKRHANGPWFLYLAFNAPHQPNQPTPERLARFAHLKAPNRAAYAAQLSLMDDAIGTVMDAVRESGQDSRTLAFFFSDNGGPITKGAPNGAQNTPLRGGKGDLYEGGVRVPFVASWPGRLPSGKDYASPVSSLDVFATALACAGVSVPTDRKYDGVDLVPFLIGENNGVPHENLFWRCGVDQQWAMRAGDWKLVRIKGQPDELYDLAADIGEARNLADTKPEVAQRLAARLDAWDKELLAPVFLGSSVKNEDWGPGGANQRNRSNPQPKSSRSAAPAKPNLILADARPFLETGLPIFTNDNASRRQYRLPSLWASSTGTVIAVSQLRWGPNDFAAQELVCRRSEDGGNTWGPEISIRRDAETKHCMFNGCIVEDTEARKLILHFIEFPADQGRRWFDEVFFSRGGGHCQTESSDDGKTWSEPVLQIPVANADGWKGASSLNNNHGVQLQHGPHRGRLVMNARVFQPGVTTWRAKGGIVYSDDHGLTWRIGGVPFPEQECYQTESCLVETAGGGIYVNYRKEGQAGEQRLYHRSDDGGQTVSQQGIHADLPALSCNAGMARYSRTPQDVILLTMPATAGRRDLTCFASFDEGRTWPVRRRIAPDGGYSDAAVLSDGTVLVAYEPDGARKGIVLARFNLAWLMETERSVE